MTLFGWDVTGSRQTVCLASSAPALSNDTGLVCDWVDTLELEELVCTCNDSSLTAGGGAWPGCGAAGWVAPQQWPACTNSSRRRREAGDLEPDWETESGSAEEAGGRFRRAVTQPNYVKVRI